MHTLNSKNNRANFKWLFFVERNRCIFWRRKKTVTAAVDGYNPCNETRKTGSVSALARLLTKINVISLARRNIFPRDRPTCKLAITFKHFSLSIFAVLSFFFYKHSQNTHARTLSLSNKSTKNVQLRLHAFHAGYKMITQSSVRREYHNGVFFSFFAKKQNCFGKNK